MNVILEKIIEDRRGMYVHALEVDSVGELESCIDALVDELVREGYVKADIRDFVETLSIYYIGDDEEMEANVHSFNIDDYIDDNILI